jgi:hypothetical protein
VEYCVFIQSNEKQHLGAVIAEYALRRNSRHNDKFDIRVMNYDDFAFLREHEGRYYLRDGGKRLWVRDDLQSFTPTRFLPPQLMNYTGRAVVIDPDVFARADIWELLSRDMQGQAIVCRPKSGSKGRRGCLATSVMLLDNARLTHWKVEDQFDAMFRFERDYMKWVCLKYEDPETIGLFEPEWNDFDHLGPQTKMLHTTKRKTQPWKTGLPVDFRPADSFQLFPPKHWIRRARRALFGDYGLTGKYKQNPDPNQVDFFFGLLRECLDKGIVSEAQLREEMLRNHIRHDAFEVLERTPPLAA